MAQTGHEIDTALGASFLYPVLGPDERRRFLASARPQSWRAGEPVFCMGDAGGAMFLVQTGEVRISVPSAQGRAILLAELTAGAVFGELALLDGGVRSADATATTNCTLMVFERRALLDLLKDNWPLTEAVLKLICTRLRKADEGISDLASIDLRGRLAKTLLARAKPAPGGGPPRVSDTQGALAGLVGGSRETVNRCLRKWERGGLIAMAGGRISLLDVERLARAAG